MSGRLWFILSPVPRWMCGIFGNESLGEREPQSLGYALAIRWVGAVAVADMALLDKYLRIAHSAGRVLASGLLVFRRHQSPQLARLCKVVAIQLALVIVIYLARNGQRRLFEVRLVVPLAIAVRLVAYRAPCVVVGAHLSVTVIRMVRTARLIYRYQVVIYAQAVALRIAIGEQSPLQHLIGRKTNAIYNVHRVKCRLLGLSKEVLGVAVKLQDADIVQREITVIPHLRKVKGVDVILFRLLLAHQLHLHQPSRIFATLYGLEQISLVRLAVFGNHSLGLGVGHVFDALQGAQMELHPSAAVVGIYEAICVNTKAVHMAE